jgi:hypothetical protein
VTIAFEYFATHCPTSNSCDDVGNGVGDSRPRRGPPFSFVRWTEGSTNVESIPAWCAYCPKSAPPPMGTALGSFSRYACVHRSGAEVRWSKIPARHCGTDPQAEYANVLLLPWPLRVRESDFHPVEGSVRRLTNEPFGYFEFARPKSSIWTSWTALSWSTAINPRAAPNTTSNRTSTPLICQTHRPSRMQQRKVGGTSRPMSMALDALDDNSADHA